MQHPSKSYHGPITYSSPGSSTSCAAIKSRTGFRDTHKVQVENGKLIYWAELLKSVDEAADKFLALHCPQRKHHFSA